MTIGTQNFRKKVRIFTDTLQHFSVSVVTPLAMYERVSTIREILRCSEVFGRKTRTWYCRTYPKKISDGADVGWEKIGFEKNSAIYFIFI